MIKTKLWADKGCVLKGGKSLQYGKIIQDILREGPIAQSWINFMVGLVKASIFFSSKSPDMVSGA